MEDDTKMVIKIICGVILGIFILCTGILFIDYKVRVNITETNIVKVYIQTGIMEEAIIYKGKKAFINIESGGMTTTITIYRKLFPFKVIDKVYSDKTIRVEGD